jgi:hypothetical protein
MRSPLGGSIATCLIFVPLVAVPLLAVLGMPQLATSKAATTGDDLKFAADEANPSGGNADLLAPVRVSDPKSDAATDASVATHSARAGVKDPDPFAEFSRDSGAASRPATTTGAAKRTQRWTSEGNGLPQKALLSNDPPGDDRGPASAAERTAASGSIDEHAADEPGRETPAKMPAARRQLPEAEAIVALGTEPAAGSLASRTADASTAELRSPAPRSASRTALTWKHAVDRLNALGIRDFQLQPGERDGDFNFSCRFASRTNPRVIHRFEAEASDPLEAVNQVLRQLDDWRARHLDRNQGAHTASAESRPTPRAPESTEVEITNRAF